MSTSLLANKLIDGVPHICEVNDLSRSGARLRRLGGPTRSEPWLELELMLPRRHDITRLAALVVYEDGDALGVRFVGMTEGQRAQLHRFTNERELGR
ncbi:MAG: PilZ domain-containing protein [Myxococcales bacterium]|nr:PilZ domain-containing protein [Myxococcales bacterium]